MQPQNYIFTKVSVSTNAIELKNNQQRLLRQNYQKNMKLENSYSSPQNSRQTLDNELSESNTFASSSHQDSNLFLFRTNSMPRLNKNCHEEIIKNSLSNELANQIAQKQQLKKFERNEQLKIQRQMVKYNKMLQDKEISKNKNFIHNFQQEALYNTKMKQTKRLHERNLQLLQKNQIDKQYRNSNEIIEKKMQEIDSIGNFNSPSNRVSQSSISDYSLNSEIGIFPKKSVHRPNYEEASELKMRLKETLLEQMRMNSERKINQKIQKINTPFIDEKFKRFDNTIVNPVDLKIAKDNPYLMKELLGRKIKQQKTEMNGNTLRRMEANPEYNIKNLKENSNGNKQYAPKEPSYLSLRGSNSLSKLGY